MIVGAAFLVFFGGMFIVPIVTMFGSAGLIRGWVVALAWALYLAATVILACSPVVPS